MAVTSTKYEHIVLTDDGVPLIAGTTMKVIELVLEQTVYGWSPEELRFQHPCLSMGQIHSALAYYWDHKDELDRDMAQRYTEVQQLRSVAPPSPLLARLKASGLR